MGLAKPRHDRGCEFLSLILGQRLNRMRKRHEQVRQMGTDGKRRCLLQHGVVPTKIVNAGASFELFARCRYRPCGERLLDGCHLASLALPNCLNRTKLAQPLKHVIVCGGNDVSIIHHACDKFRGCGGEDDLEVRQLGRKLLQLRDKRPSWLDRYFLGPDSIDK